jgi:hypothetical protein
VTRQLFEFVVRLLGRREFHEFDLVELVLPDEPAHVRAVGSGFAAETRRVGRVGQRKQPAVENLFAMEVRQRHFGRRNQEQIPVAGDLEQSSSNFGRLPVPVSAARFTMNGGSTSR